MSYMGGNLRARVDRDHPEAWAICDRCGFVRNHSDLAPQMQYAGSTLTATGSLVCRDTCLDVPHEFNQPLRLPPDPVPVKDPRPRQFPNEDVPVQTVREIIGD